MSQDRSGVRDGEPGPPVQAMRMLYDCYFSSHDYQRRYPAPNRATLQFLLQQGRAADAASILDVGCGDGRYALALLAATSAHITGCDISIAALSEFAAKLRVQSDENRVRLVHGQVESMGLDAAGAENCRHDLSILLFGVLSHAGDVKARVCMLKAIHRQTKPDGRLILTVPSIWRRRPLEMIRDIWRRASRSKLAYTQVGDIEFARVIGGQSQEFFYHLYTVAGLRRELAQGGWTMQVCQAESLLPEWLVTQYRWAGQLDGMIRPLLPAALGYGIRVMAFPDSQPADESAV